VRCWSLVAILCAGCGAAAGTPPDAGDALCVDPAGVLAPTFTNVQHILTARCGTCHGSALPPDVGAPAYAHLVGRSAVDVPPVLDSCGGAFVTGGDLAHSYLYVKLSSDTPCAGSRMPLGEFAPVPLPTCELELIQYWITAGAAND
jgi:hypothetical protein